MSEEQLDRAIDRAVMEMMSVDPPAGLRHRVMARLHTPPRRIGVFWPGLGLAAVALAAIVLAVGALWQMPGSPREERPEIMAGNQPQAPAPAPLPAAPEAATQHPAAAAGAGEAARDLATPPATATAPRVEQLPPPPRMDSVFGPPSDRVSAANAPGHEIPAANVRLEFTITREGASAGTGPKGVTMVVADRQSGRSRSAVGGALNVDARPEILEGRRVRVTAKVEYQLNDGDQPVRLSESFTTILDDGQRLLVWQSGDPGSKDTVKIELKATISPSRP